MQAKRRGERAGDRHRQILDAAVIAFAEKGFVAAGRALALHGRVPVTPLVLEDVAAVREEAVLVLVAPALRPLFDDLARAVVARVVDAPVHAVAALLHERPAAAPRGGPAPLSVQLVVARAAARRALAVAAAAAAAATAAVARGRPR